MLTQSKAHQVNLAHNKQAQLWLPHKMEGLQNLLGLFDHNINQA